MQSERRNLQSGEINAEECKPEQDTGLHTSTEIRIIEFPQRSSLRAVSSVVEHYNDTVGVTGSSPVPPTIFSGSKLYSLR